MTQDDINGIIEFLKGAEALKSTLRSGYTSSGRPESTAEHTWRLCLMAMLIGQAYPDIDLARLLKICLVHDLGEAISGDVPAPLQAPGVEKSDRERADLGVLVTPLPGPLRADVLGLWEEYEAAATQEAKLAKALDKLETILQHNQGRFPGPFDHAFNLGYGRAYTAMDPLIAEMRRILDRETEALALPTSEARDS